MNMNFMCDYIPPVDIKTEPYIPETGETDRQTDRQAARQTDKQEPTSVMPSVSCCRMLTAECFGVSAKVLFSV